MAENDSDKELCEGCERTLRDDEGHDTEDMVILCDDCWEECVKDVDSHSDECQCGKCSHEILAEREQEKA